MPDIQQIIARAEAHIAKSGAARSTVSRKLFGNGNRLDEIATGKTSVTIRKLLQADETLTQLERAA